MLVDGVGTDLGPPVHATAGSPNDGVVETHAHNGLEGLGTTRSLGILGRSLLRNSGSSGCSLLRDKDEPLVGGFEKCLFSSLLKSEEEGVVLHLTVAEDTCIAFSLDFVQALNEVEWPPSNLDSPHRGGLSYSFARARPTWVGPSLLSLGLDFWNLDLTQLKPPRALAQAGNTFNFEPTYSGAPILLRPVGFCWPHSSGRPFLAQVGCLVRLAHCNLRPGARLGPGVMGMTNSSDGLRALRTLPRAGFVWGT